MMTKRRSVSSHLVGLLFFFVITTQSVFAVDISAKIKAAYIYNLLQFITFPDASLLESKLNVCIMGENYFGNILNKIEGEPTPQAKLHFIYLKNVSDSAALKSCNVLYLTKSVKKETQQVLAAIDNKNIVTIADYSPFVTDGGLIELFDEKGKILFRINTDLIKESHFKVAAQLVQLGRN